MDPMHPFASCLRRGNQPCYLLILVSALWACSSNPGPSADGGVDGAVDGRVDGRSVDGSRSDGVRPPDSRVPEKVVTCGGEPLKPTAGGTCTVTPGEGKGLVLRGTVLAPETLYENGQVVVGADGRISCVGCECLADAAAQKLPQVLCATGVISPGLINPHDHLDYCLDRPKTTAARYDHRHEWRVGKNGKAKISASKNVPAEGVAYGELRMILGGATSIVGTGEAKKLLRNLDGNNEGLGKKSVYYGVFPLGDSDGTMLKSGCNYPKLPTADSVDSSVAYITHVAEGINSEAHNEYLCLSGRQQGGVDLTRPKAAFIHGIGLTATDGLEMAQSHTSLIWTPRGNLSLYGMTADVVMLKQMGINIALGTDWTPSGSMNMLRELACADYLNDTHYGKPFTPRELWAMATQNAARAAQLDDVIGVLAPAHFADIAIFDGAKNAGYSAVYKAQTQDVVLVLRGGEVLYGDDAVVAVLAKTEASPCEALSICGRDKRVCLERETGMTLSALEDKVGKTAYPLFFCGTPDGEPTCVPSRPNQFAGAPSPTDTDGDGVLDEKDTCPAVFNPPRPMNGNQQPDTDSDTAGDECDVCPLNANTTSCNSSTDPNDQDGDGVPNDRDNCKAVPNKDQADKDKDQLGDACDTCAKPNPGGAPCPTTIRELRDRTLGLRPADGTVVKIGRAVITAVRQGNFGYYVREGRAAYEAIFVYLGKVAPAAKNGTALKVGDVVRLSGKLAAYNGIDELTDPADVEVTGSEAATPVDVKAADVATGAPTAEGLESHLVALTQVTVVTAVDATKNDQLWVSESAAQCGTPKDGCAKISDFFYDGGKQDGWPPAKVGAKYERIIGVVDSFKDDFSVQPRDASDLVVKR